MSTKFVGFDGPKENWSKLPHDLIDELSNINSVSELKVILYILRHTWGFSDADKKITIDEFSNGRKRADGSRMDGGCGIHRNSVKAGLDAAIEHGYIIMEEDARDLARIKRRYSIKIRGSNVVIQGVKTCDPGGQSLTPGGSKVDPRTERDTIRKKPIKATAASGSDLSKKAMSEKLEDSDKDGRATLELLRAHPTIVYLDTDAKRIAMQMEQDYSLDQIRVALRQTADRHDAKIATGDRGIMAPLAYARGILVKESEPTKAQIEMVQVSIPVSGSRGESYDQVVIMSATKAKAAGYKIIERTE